MSRRYWLRAAKVAVERAAESAAKSHTKGATKGPAKRHIVIRPGWPNRPHPLPIHMAHVGQWYHAMSDLTRLSILEFLSQRERCVTELQHIMGAAQSSVSYHLKVLRESGLVSEHREGRWKYFSLRADTIEYMSQFPRVIGPGKHVGTCPLTCCQGPLTYQENLIRSGA